MKTTEISAERQAEIAREAGAALAPLFNAMHATQTERLYAKMMGVTLRTLAERQAVATASMEGEQGDRLDPERLAELSLAAAFALACGRVVVAEAHVVPCRHFNCRVRRLLGRLAYWRTS